MEIFGLSVKGVIRPNIKVLFVPFILAGFLLLLSLVVVQNTYTRVSAEIKKLNESEKAESLLQEKVNLLQEMSPIVISQTDQTVIALPEKNPSITMLIQLNLLAEKYSLTFANKEAGSHTKFQEDILKTPISFSVGGNLDQLLFFVNEIKTVAPLSTIDEMNVTAATDEGVGMSIKMSVYFSKFPEKLPPLTQPIKTLTAEEKETLDKISFLKKPVFIEQSTTRSEERQDPFSWE